MPKISASEAREKIAQTKGPEFWRSLEELAGSQEFREMMHREFPKGASEWLDSVSRRGFLKLMGASLALAGVSGCAIRTPEKIAPWVKSPEQVVPGLEPGDGGHAAPGVSGHEQVVLALAGVREPHEPALGADRVEPVVPPGDELVRVDLVPGVPDEPVLVLREVEGEV